MYVIYIFDPSTSRFLFSTWRLASRGEIQRNQTSGFPRKKRAASFSSQDTTHSVLQYYTIFLLLFSLQTLDYELALDRIGAAPPSPGVVVVFFFFYFSLLPPQLQLKMVCVLNCIFLLLSVRSLLSLMGAAPLLFFPLFLLTSVSLSHTRRSRIRRSPPERSDAIC